MTTVPPSPIIGGRYQIVRRLGPPGGQGDVYLAVDSYEGDEVALKLLNNSVVASGRQWVEAQILRHLADNHILPIRNADLDSGRPYLVTDVARHGSLDGLLAQRGARGLDVDAVVRLIRHACMGVARAHDVRLLHNDIKPGNLFLNAEGECLVGDFGLATQIPAGSARVMPAGFTLDTVAPEIAANHLAATASIESDVYSMGATAYTLIAARLPNDFSGAASLADRLAVVATQTPPRLWDLAPHVPRTVQSAIEKAMDRDPSNRFHRMTELAAALGARRSGKRVWNRTDQHVGHLGCWCGTQPRGGTPINVCLEPGPTSKRVQVSARHANSGNQLHRATRSGLARNAGALVRSAIAAVQ